MQLASSLGPRFYLNIFKCKQISETGAQQVLGWIEYQLLIFCYFCEIYWDDLKSSQILYFKRIKYLFWMVNLWIKGKGMPYRWKNSRKLSLFLGSCFRSYTTLFLWLFCNLESILSYCFYLYHKYPWQLEKKQHHTISLKYMTCVLFCFQVCLSI